jgi:hypothetical protein
LFANSSGLSTAKILTESSAVFDSCDKTYTIEIRGIGGY